jgi:quercetin dioxygenase-like cupin family protein
MKKFAVFAESEVAPAEGYPVPGQVTGVREARLMSPEGYSLFECVADLDPGATYTWSAEHGDEALYVVDGELEIEGRKVGPASAVVVESGVPAHVRANAPTRVVHCGSWDPEPPADGLFGPPAPDGHGVHVVGPDGWFISGAKDGVHAVWYADSTCPTCRISLFTVYNDQPGPQGGKAHIHTVDEIIYVLEGSMRFGSYEFGPGTAVSIPGNVRYAQWAGANGCRFLNFRRDTSEQIYYEKGGVAGPTLPEGGLSRGGYESGDVVHLSPVA